MMDQIITKRARCACGKGFIRCFEVTKQTSKGPMDPHIEDERVFCPDCEAKYHIEHWTPLDLPPLEKMKMAESYLVPNGETMDLQIYPKVIHLSDNDYIACNYTREQLQEAINELHCCRFSTCAKLPVTKDCIARCQKQYGKRSNLAVIEYIQRAMETIRLGRVSWDKNSMAEYRKEEWKRIEKNQKLVSDTLTRSVKIEYN